MVFRWSNGKKFVPSQIGTEDSTSRRWPGQHPLNGPTVTKKTNDKTNKAERLNMHARDSLDRACQGWSKMLRKAGMHGTHILPGHLHGRPLPALHVTRAAFASTARHPVLLVASCALLRFGYPRLVIYCFPSL